MPAPGDAGSALGAAALVFKEKLIWRNPYLGTPIMQGLSVKESGKRTFRK